MSFFDKHGVTVNSYWQITEKKSKNLDITQRRLRKQNPNQIIEYLVIQFSRIFGNIAERHLQPRLCTFDNLDIYNITA